MSKSTCPNCGNTNSDTIEDNGLKPTSSEYTLLCIARVKPADWAFKHTMPDPDQLDADGNVACGMQWPTL